MEPPGLFDSLISRFYLTILIIHMHDFFQNKKEGKIKNHMMMK